MLPEISEQQERKRLLISVWTYAYEFMSDMMVTDRIFEAVSKQIKPEIPTNNEDLDNFFRTEFKPMTLEWIHKHPELHDIAELYQRIKCRNANR